MEFKDSSFSFIHLNSEGMLAEICVFEFVFVVRSYSHIDPSLHKKFNQYSIV